MRAASYLEGMAGFMQSMRSFLVGEPIEPIDPAAIHISQVADEVYNAYAPGATANCGPAVLVMAIRLLGRTVPGEGRFTGEALIEHVRYLATGNTNRLVGTHNLHLQRVLRLAGIESKVMTHPKDMLTAVMRGQPLIMAGNPTVRGCYTDRYDYIDIRRWDSGHWILLSRYNPERRTFTVNDPQSTIGPIEATAAELHAFNSRDGNFGIAMRG